MDLKAKVKKQAGAKESRIVFPETQDPRVLRAAQQLLDEQICAVTLLGEEHLINRRLEEENINLSEEAEVLDVQDFTNLQSLVEGYYYRNKDKGISKEEAQSVLENPLFFGAALVDNDYADGCVAGSIAATGDVIRAAIKCIGLAESSSIVSSIFLMMLPDGKVITYGDCGVVPYPDSEQLANIAVDSACTHRLLTGEEPRVAMLSFSSKGSARHDSIDKVTEALKIARDKDPNLVIDGELQFDAAFVPEVAVRKAPESAVAGKANVFIFPNLDAGNIAYKITERLAGAKATGPILQGLAKPMMDLSRGCSWQDIVNAACVALLMKK